MLIYRAYKTGLKLNNRERTLLAGCAGTARFAFNWGLRQKIDEYAATCFWQEENATIGRAKCQHFRLISFLAAV